MLCNQCDAFVTGSSQCDAFVMDMGLLLWSAVKVMPWHNHAAKTTSDLLWYGLAGS